MIDGDLAAALDPVVEALERAGVEMYIGGSVASSTLGILRATRDVDLVAALRLEHVPGFVTALQDDYYVDEHAVREAIGRRASFNLIHLATMFKVDIFILKTRDYDAVAMARRTFQVEGTSPTARRYAMASPEDVILAKLEWFRLGGETSDQQWKDVLGILKVQGRALDIEFLTTWARELGVSDLLDRARSASGLD